ncbi:MAG: type II toxin-antitoxin system VapC family toxin [Armatimonadota bacterium]|nr:type II toxin-antitoxin system VapC family toxin [Armatimonadota bacterium]
MRFLLDSNVLLRWSDSRALEHAACAEAISKLAAPSNVILVCPQVIIESYVVATRPVDVNGLGFSAAEARQTLTDIEASFPCLPEPHDIIARWRKLIQTHGVTGKQAHDAHIAALMQAHGVGHLITLNVGDFARYQDITPLTPSDVLAR